MHYLIFNLNPWTKNDWHLHVISPHNIIPESHSKVIGIKEMISKLKKLSIVTNSPCQDLRKCRENSKENMHTDVRV